ncbi:MAG: hypothetical protein K8J31_22835 [Anaerolineae bacterium]|nr:hypothetical protein [Anaerolineae bacterium]
MIAETRSHRPEIEEESHRVHQTVQQAIIGGLCLDSGVIGQTGQGGRHRGNRAQRHQAVACFARRSGERKQGDEIEQRPQHPTAEGQVGQNRVQRVADKFAMQHIGTPAGRLAALQDHGMQRLRCALAGLPESRRPPEQPVQLNTQEVWNRGHRPFAFQFALRVPLP